MFNRTLKLGGVFVCSALVWSAAHINDVYAQTGVDDDRVSLPDGPGSLEGVGENVEIDPNMGSMRYSVAVKTPTGRLNLSPDLSLSYSSSGSAGALGVGWSMEMPSMERMTSRRAPQYQTDDYFAFDGGDELVLIDDSGPDYVYRDRFESNFKRYTWVNAGTTNDYWIVEYPDGSKGYFGASSEGTLVESSRSLNDNGHAFRYQLVDREDEFGNRLHYIYDKFDQNKPLLTEVQWVFTDGVPLYRAMIGYESRPDLISDASGGFEEILSYRVDNLRVFASNELTREYVLTYQPESETGGFSRLGQVTEYGLGGAAGGFKNPIEFSFDYQRALGVECEGESCDKPYMVNMGMLPGGSAFDSGYATLIDINGDALPDIVNTADGAHQFFVNRLVDDGQGGFSQSFEAGYDSAVGTSGAFRLDGDKTQTLDVNGDGFSDLVNLATGKFLIKDPDANDWKEMGSDLDVTQVSSTSPATRRFIDYNNDKRIDVLVASNTETRIYENTGGTFDSRALDFIGVGFDSNLQLSDINGDGTSDAVQLNSDGSVRYRINLGWGKFSEWRNISGASLTPLEQEAADLEDLNGDGRDDIVVVTGGQVKYWLNRGDRFDDPITISSSEINDLPTRDMGTQVFYADMNANGSEDIVWIKSGQDVQFLELFPQRPNLMNKVNNGIGFEQRITYSTAARQEASARGTDREWTRSLNTSMAVVGRSDIYVTLTGDEDGTGLHDVVDYWYQNGFYDGIEKQFRGFARVEAVRQGNMYQEGETTITEYNLGDEDVYYNGLLLRSETWSGDAAIKEDLSEYSDCALSEVPTATELTALGRFPVRYVCQTGTTAILKEGAPESEWKTIQILNEYDGYGNLTKITEEGVVGVEGDEIITETTFADPTNIWSLSIPVEQKIYDEVSGDTKVRTYYYDGEPFVGLPKGEVQVGFLSREEVKVNNEGKTLMATRQMRDDYGNVLETLDPNGSPDQMTTHRRRYTYDQHNLFISATEVLFEDEQGPYSLRRESRFDTKWQKPNYLSSWVILRDGQPQSPENSTSVVYDDLGRMIQKIMPGDENDKATVEYSYDLGDPFSSVTVSYRSTLNGAIDEQTKLCFDGKGRSYQERTRLKNNEWLVTGFTIFNDRGAEVEEFQPYLATDDTCELDPPTDVASTVTRYDGLFRPLTKTLDDADIYGEASMQRFDYLPLKEVFYDYEDTASGSAHEDTPLTRVYDGQNRIVEMQRTLRGDDGELQTASYKLYYDNTGSFTGYEDPVGTRHELSVDLADRITSVTNPNIGTLRYEYDDAGNVIRREDARGKVLQATYDGGNRLVERWEASDREGTLVQFSYDYAGDCAATECTQLANRLARVTYPLRDAEGGVSTGSRRYGYDARGRRIFHGMKWGDLDLAVSTAFDNRDRVTSRIFPGGKTVNRSYDAAGRLSEISGFISDFEYTEQTMLKRLGYSNGASIEFTYDSILRPKTLVSKDGAGGVIEQFEFDRDRMGGILTAKDMSGRTDRADTSASYTYDAWYRLVQAELAMDGEGAETLDYVFTHNDNVTSIVSSLGAESVAHVGEVAYDAARPNAVSKAGSTDYAYNEMGQMVGRGGSEMTWDYLDRMTAHITSTDSYHYMYGEDEQLVALMGQDSLTFYGPEGFEFRDGIATMYVKNERQRIGRHESLSLQAFMYPDVAPVGAPDQRITAADAWAVLSGQDVTVPMEAFAKPERVLGAAAARMLLDEESGETTFLHFDHLGSITSATTEGGEVRGERNFYPTGMVRFSEGYVDPYGFTGQEHMPDGMLRFAFRFLDPRVGRWASFDPAFLIVDVDAMESLGEATTGYAYVANNFINSVDPLGLQNTGSPSAPSGGTSSPPNRPPPSPPTGGSNTASSSQGSSGNGGSTGQTQPSEGDKDRAVATATANADRDAATATADADRASAETTSDLDRTAVVATANADREAATETANADREAATATANADREVAKDALKVSQSAVTTTAVVNSLAAILNTTGTIVASIISAEASRDVAETNASSAENVANINNAP